MRAPSGINTLLSKRVKNYPFTLFDYNDDHIDKLKSLDLKYILWGHEECPTTGRKHLQGYMVLKKEKTLSAMKQFIGIPTIHIEQSRLGFIENYKYCTKTRDSDPVPNADIFEQGERPKTPKDRGDDEKQRWEDARAAAKSGDFGNYIISYYDPVHRNEITYCPCTVECPCDFGMWCFECSVYCI